MRWQGRGRWWAGLLGVAVLAGCESGSAPPVPNEDETLPAWSDDTEEDAASLSAPEVGPLAVSVPPRSVAPPIDFPSVPGWRFYGPQDNVPSQVLGVTQDDDGNLWVAGGEEGLFVLRNGATTFQRFTLADGLRPYGFLPPNGAAPKGDKYLKVTAVTGGKGSTVYVGYQGAPDCESNYY